MIEFPLISIALLLACSATFSSTETSFFSLGRVHLKELEAKHPRQYAGIRFLLERPASLVATLMIGNEAANVVISNILAAYFNSRFDSWVTITLINVSVALPLIIIFGEVTPRIFAAKFNTTFARFLYPIVWVAYRVTFPVRILIEGFVNGASKLLGMKPVAAQPVSEEEFLHALEDSKSKGAIGDSEKELIENVFDLDDEQVREVATPIKSFLTVHKDDKIRDIIPAVIEKEELRIPVIGDFPNEVVGVLYMKDMLTLAHREEDDVRVSHLMKEPIFVEPGMSVDVLFKRLRQLKTHIAFVAPDNRTVSGVVTMDDILEEIFGELIEPENGDDE